MSLDPCETNPQHYTVLLETEHVRVLNYLDSPGERTVPHAHPDSVMLALSSFDRRLHADGVQRDVTIEAGSAHWLPAQQHAGENIGVTPTHVIFVELKLPGLPASAEPAVGPVVT